MNVQMINGLSAILIGVDHQSVAIGGEAQLRSNLTGLHHQMPHDAFVVELMKLGHGLNGLFRNQKHVYRGLGLNVFKRQANIVFVNDVGRNFAVDDFCKNAH